VEVGVRSDSRVRKPGSVSSNPPVLNGDIRIGKPSFRTQMLQEERRNSSVISAMHHGLQGSSMQIIILFWYNVTFNLDSVPLIDSSHNTSWGPER